MDFDDKDDDNGGDWKGLRNDQQEDDLKAYLCSLAHIIPREDEDWQIQMNNCEEILQ